MYGPYAREARAVLVPFVCDAYGRFHPEAYYFIRNVVGKYAADRRNAYSPAAYTSYALSRHQSRFRWATRAPLSLHWPSSNASRSRNLLTLPLHPRLRQPVPVPLLRPRMQPPRPAPLGLLRRRCRHRYRCSLRRPTPPLVPILPPPLHVRLRLLLLQRLPWQRCTWLLHRLLGIPRPRAAPVVAGLLLLLLSVLVPWPPDPRLHVMPPRALGPVPVPPLVLLLREARRCTWLRARVHGRGGSR